MRLIWVICKMCIIYRLETFSIYSLGRKFQRAYHGFTIVGKCVWINACEKWTVLNRFQINQSKKFEGYCEVPALVQKLVLSND